MTVPATPRFCAACGVPRQWGGRFCGGCGASLLENSGSTPSAPSAPPGPSWPVLDLAALSPIPILKDRSLWRPPCRRLRRRCHHPPEEVAKLLGVLVVVHVVGASYTPRTFLFLGAVSGLAFGTAEAVLKAGDLTGSGGGHAKELVVVAVWRLLADSLLHACMAGITAFFLGLAHQRARQFTALVVTGLLVAGVLHGIYDAAADAGDALAVLVFAAVLATFIAYAERGEGVLERLAGLSPADPPAALSTEAL